MITEAPFKPSPLTETVKKSGIRLGRSIYNLPIPELIKQVANSLIKQLQEATYP